AARAHLRRRRGDGPRAVAVLLEAARAQAAAASPDGAGLPRHRRAGGRRRRPLRGAVRLRRARGPARLRDARGIVAIHRMAGVRGDSRGRRRLAPPLDAAELRPHAGRRHPADLPAAVDARRPALRGGLPRHRVAVLGAEPRGRALAARAGRDYAGTGKPGRARSSTRLKSARMRASAASVSASNRSTITGVVFEARMSPKPSGYSTRRPSIVFTSVAPSNFA